MRSRIEPMKKIVRMLRSHRDHPELLQSAKGDFKRYDRGLKQQSESHHEKILWIANVSRHRTGSLPLSRQAPGAGNRPQILLTRPEKEGPEPDRPQERERSR